MNGFFSYLKYSRKVCLITLVFVRYVGVVMRIIWLLWKNLLALSVGTVLALGLFYVVYNSDILTADILQRQIESETLPDVSYTIDNNEILVKAMRAFVFDSEFTLKVALNYDETKTTVFAQNIVSPFTHSFTQNNGKVLFELYGNQEIEADQVLLTIGYGGDAHSLLVGDVTLSVDGVEEGLSVGTLDGLEQGDSETVHY